jgi:hypothetical protein
MSNGSNRVCWGASGGTPSATPLVEGTVYGCSAADNVSVGQYALQSVTSGTSNVALGCEALCSLTTGISNVAIGRALVSSVNGSQNTAVGAGAMFLTTSGCLNTVVGNNAAVFNTTGSCNTAIGQGSLYANSSGCFNAAVGKDALSLSTTNCNVGVGFEAGCTLTTGANNVMLGAGSQPATASSSNSVTLGNSSISVIRAQVTTITSLSDARDKTNVTALPVGLDFVNSLNPVKFTWQMREPNEVKDGTSEAGFIAQELQSAQVAAGASYLGLVYDENPEKLEASAGKLLPVLVKAIQELSAKVDSLQAELNTLKANG